MWGGDIEFGAHEHKKSAGVECTSFYVSYYDILARQCRLQQLVFLFAWANNRDPPFMHPYLTRHRAEGQVGIDTNP